MKVSVIVPDDYLGNVIGDLNSRRGQIQGQENRTGATQVDSLVPLANILVRSNFALAIGCFLLILQLCFW